MPLPRPAETLTRQLLFDKKKGVSPTHPRRHFLVVSSEKFNFTRVNRYQERNESFLRLISVELAGEKEWKCQLFFTVNGEYKLVKIFLNLIPLQFEREGDKYREYRV